MSEAEILKAIHLELGTKTDLLLMRNSVGMAKHTNDDGFTRHVRYGLCKASSDLVGVLRPSGRWFALEVKAPGKKPTEDQHLWLELIRSYGGFACWVDNVDDAMAALVRARMGMDS